MCGVGGVRAYVEKYDTLTSGEPRSLSRVSEH